MWVYGHAHATAQLKCSQKDNFAEFGLSFHHVGPTDQTLIARCGGKCLYLLSYLTGPHLPFLDAEPWFLKGHMGIISLDIVGHESSVPTI